MAAPDPLHRAVTDPGPPVEAHHQPGQGAPRGSFRGRSGQVLVALGVAGLLLFNFPLLLIWDQGEGTLFGLPSLPVALFVIWAALIAALAWVVERGGGPRLPDKQGGGGASDDTSVDEGAGP